MNSLLIMLGAVMLAASILYVVYVWRANERYLDRLAKDAALKAEARRIEEDQLRRRRLRSVRNPAEVAAEFRAIGRHREAEELDAEHRRRREDYAGELTGAVTLAMLTGGSPSPALAMAAAPDPEPRSGSFGGDPGFSTGGGFGGDSGSGSSSSSFSSGGDF